MGFPRSSVVKNLPTKDAWVRYLGQKDPLEKEMATHSSNFAWEILGTEEPGRLQSMGSQRVRHDWMTKQHHQLESNIRRNNYMLTAAAAKLLQSCPTLGNPIDSSPPGSAVPGILQAKTLEWAAISFSSAWKGNVKVKSLSHVRLFATPWTAAHQALPSMGFSRQEYWSGVPLPFLNYMLIPIINLTFNSRQGIVA